MPGQVDRPGCFGILMDMVVVIRRHFRHTNAVVVRCRALPCSVPFHLIFVKRRVEDMDFSAWFEKIPECFDQGSKIGKVLH